ncbi:MAG TPA: hypothetical protein VM370_02100, partial [Candidatus Thermoplasmatota archaeon]|nr:hypothetical protein [Candidatus Thermoplasmatota archaeon]
MEVATGLLLAESIFQVVVGLVLVTAGPGARHRAMAALLFVNAAQPISGALTLPDADRLAQLIGIIDLA